MDGETPKAGTKTEKHVPWIEKYRPKTFDEIVGNEGATGKDYFVSGSPKLLIYQSISCFRYCIKISRFCQRW